MQGWNEVSTQAQAQAHAPSSRSSHWSQQLQEEAAAWGAATGARLTSIKSSRPALPPPSASIPGSAVAIFRNSA